MVNFGPLAAEIVSLVWGTPGNFNGFRVLATLLQRRQLVLNSRPAEGSRQIHVEAYLLSDHVKKQSHLLYFHDIKIPKESL